MNDIVLGVVLSIPFWAGTLVICAGGLIYRKKPQEN